MTEEKKNPSAETEAAERLVDTTYGMCEHMLKACLQDLTYPQLPDTLLENRAAVAHLTRISAYFRLAAFLRLFVGKELTSRDLHELDSFLVTETQQMYASEMTPPTFVSSLLRNIQKMLDEELNSFQSQSSQSNQN